MKIRFILYIQPLISLYRIQPHARLKQCTSMVQLDQYFYEINYHMKYMVIIKERPLMSCYSKTHIKRQTHSRQSQVVYCYNITSSRHHSTPVYMLRHRHICISIYMYICAHAWAWLRKNRSSAIEIASKRSIRAAQPARNSQDSSTTTVASCLVGPTGPKTSYDSK
jgi:hypothetical protein